jgi:beta-glucosidase-like glycosyl hydrolase
LLLTKKIARLVSTSISNRDGDDLAEQYHRLRREVLELGVGGYTVFGGNVDSTTQLTHELAAESQHPLLVSSDLERGLGQQLDGGTVFPTQMAIGATGGHDLAFAQGWATAREALAAGIDVVFSPVADVASEPTNPIIGIRAFGGDPERVADMTTAFIRGCQQAGAAATAKHFPGHGDTRLDSHIELPTVDADRATLEAREFVPFRAAVDAGVRVVMTAHVAYPALTGDDTPATLSREIVTGLLREEMGFDGLVVTDALLMGAIAERYGAGEAAVLALDAGVDVLLMPPDAEKTIAAVRQAVRDGRLTEARIDESLERIDDLHRTLGDFRVENENHVEFPPEIEGAFGDDELPDDNHRAKLAGANRQAAAHIAARAVTLLRDDPGLIPLDAAKLDMGALHGHRVVVYTLKDRDRKMNLVWFRSAMEARLPHAMELTVTERTRGAELEGLLATASRSEAVVIAIFDDVVAWKGRSGPSEALMQTARRLIAAAPDSVVLAFTGPEVVLEVPDARVLFCCYDASEPSQCAAVAALFGEAGVSGRLPVDVPPLLQMGDGLKR